MSSEAWGYMLIGSGLVILLYACWWLMRIVIADLSRSDGEDI
jgi:hypothetical protein